MATGLIEPDRRYHTPEGYYDRHFYYIYDAVGGDPSTQVLINGQSYQRVRIPMDGDADFVLRRVNWATAAADPARGSQFNFYWPNVSEQVAKYGNLPYNVIDIPVMPEIVYPSGGFLQFGVTDFVAAAKPSGEGLSAVNFSQIIFQGVKRFKGRMPDFGVQRQYKLVPNTIVLPVLVDFSYYTFDGLGNVTGVNGLRRFSTRINTGDFELWAIGVTCDATTNGVKFALVDPIDQTWFSNRVPVLTGPFMESAINASAANVPGTFDASSSGTWGSIIPPKLYPQNTQLAIDVQSLNADRVASYVVNFHFIGANRVPCVG